MEFDMEYRRLMLEFSEGAIRNIVKKFQNDATEQEIRRELQDFEKYKQALQKKDPFQYQSWIEFTEAIHAAKGKAEFKRKKAPTQDVVANQDDIVADDENVTIYRGDSQDKCVLYGKGYTFCISRQAGGNMFSNYRLGKDSTFYFIYFKKKPKSVKDHIMVLDHTKHGYEWTFADNATREVNGGWDEIVRKYPELGIYKDLLVNKKLDDEEKVFAGTLTKFSNDPTLEKFNTFSYKQKAQALKSIIMLPNDIWETLDSTLRNEFLSVGGNLTIYQADDLKPNEIERYKKTREIAFKQLAENELVLRNQYDSIENIASVPRLAYAYAEEVFQEDQHIPDIILKGISMDAYSSYYFSADVLNFKDVPDILINGISKDPKWAYQYMLDCDDDVTDSEEFEILIKSVESDPTFSFLVAKNILQWKNIPPKILENILNHRKKEFDKAMVDLRRWVRSNPWDASDETTKLLRLSEMRNITSQLQIESTYFGKYYQKLMSSLF